MALQNCRKTDCEKLSI